MLDEFTSARLTDSKTQGYDVECIDIETIMEDYDIHRLDIVKLDIEGAERGVITRNSTNWLKATKIIIVEFHEIDIQKQCSNFLQTKGFYGYKYRTLYYFFNDKILCRKH